MAIGNNCDLGDVGWKREHATQARPGRQVARRQSLGPLGGEGEVAHVVEGEAGENHELDFGGEAAEAPEGTGEAVAAEVEPAEAGRRRSGRQPREVRQQLVQGTRHGEMPGISADD